MKKYIDKIVLGHYNKARYLYINSIYNCFRKKYDIHRTFNFNKYKSYIRNYSRIQTFEGCSVKISKIS